MSVSLSGPTVELLRIERRGAIWEVEAAVDGVKYPAFWDAVENTWTWPENAFLDYLKEQAITWAESRRGEG